MPRFSDPLSDYIEIPVAVVCLREPQELRNIDLLETDLTAGDDLVATVEHFGSAQRPAARDTHADCRESVVLAPAARRNCAGLPGKPCSAVSRVTARRVCPSRRS